MLAAPAAGRCRKGPSADVWNAAAAWLCDQQGFQAPLRAQKIFFGPVHARANFFGQGIDCANTNAEEQHGNSGAVLHDWQKPTRLGVIGFEAPSTSFTPLCHNCREGSLCATKQIGPSSSRSSTCGSGYPANSITGSLAPATLMHRQVHGFSNYDCSTMGRLKADRVAFRHIPVHGHIGAAGSRGIWDVAEGTGDADGAQQQAAEFTAAVSDALRMEKHLRPSAAFWLEGPHRERIEALREYAIGKAPLPDVRQKAIESLRICDFMITPNGAATVLEALNVLKPHEPLALLRSGLSVEFGSENEAAAQDICARPPPDPDESCRQDFTHMQVLTVDDSSTTEVDDGLSLERLPGGRLKIWIHVADPTRWLTPQDVLDLEARSRGVTMYFPTSKVTLFPLRLAEDQFSLCAGEVRCALSFGAVLEQDGGLSEVFINPSKVRVSRRLSFEEADSIVEGSKPIEDGCGQDLVALHDLAKTRKQWRNAQGAISVDLPDYDLYVEDDSVQDPRVSIVPRDKLSPSRFMVEEMMILAGEMAARTGATSGVPLPYRSQAKPVMPELKAVPAGLCREAAIRSRLTRGLVSASQVSRHASLGLEAYVQITSPIRRYVDLVAHYQLKAHLRGAQAPFTAAELDDLLTSVSEASRVRKRVSDDVANYWLAEYFRQHRDSRTWPALMLQWIKSDRGLASVLIEELGLEAQVRINRPAVPGSRLELVVAGVDVKSGMVRFEVVAKK